MEELENENDRGIYWVIFFVGLLVIGFIVHNFVFSYENDSEEVIETSETTEFDISSYIGIWQLFGNSDVPENELSIISVIEDEKIVFDYHIKDVASFEEQIAYIDGNTASFEMTDVDGGIFISGKIIFRDNKVFLAIVSSTDEDITTGTIEFRKKGEESLLG